MDPIVEAFLRQQDFGGLIQHISTTFPGGHPDGLKRSERLDYHEASFAIDPDTTGYVLIPDDALALLRGEAE
jgi:hypothetical protein